MKARRDAGEDEPDALAALTYLWCTQQGLILLFSFAKGFLTPFETLQAVLLAAAAVGASCTSRWCRARCTCFTHAGSVAHMRVLHAQLCVLERRLARGADAPRGLVTPGATRCRSRPP
jgi:hypothetical protein